MDQYVSTTMKINHHQFHMAKEMGNKGRLASNAHKEIKIEHVSMICLFMERLQKAKQWKVTHLRFKPISIPYFSNICIIYSVSQAH